MLFSTTPGSGDSRQVFHNLFLNVMCSMCEIYHYCNYIILLLSLPECSLLRSCACGVPHIPQH